MRLKLRVIDDSVVEVGSVKCSRLQLTQGQHKIQLRPVEIWREIGVAPDGELVSLQLTAEGPQSDTSSKKHYGFYPLTLLPIVRPINDFLVSLLGVQKQ